MLIIIKIVVMLLLGAGKLAPLWEELTDLQTKQHLT